MYRAKNGLEKNFANTGTLKLRCTYTTQVGQDKVITHCLTLQKKG